MIIVPDDADVDAQRQAAYEALRGRGVSADILAARTSDYLRRQHDPGFLSWLISREGRVLYSSGAVPQRSPRPPRVSERPREGLEMWMERAEEDFREASRSIHAADAGRGAICFHSHACIEKLLKAHLVARGKHPPKTHQLPELLGRQRREIRQDAVIVDACALLQKLYPQSRYPEAPMPTLNQARDAFDAARQARERLLPPLCRPR